jgi:sucrose porin
MFRWWLSLSGTGGGINDVDWGSGLRGDYSVYARNFGDLGSDNYFNGPVNSAKSPISTYS